MSEQLSTILGMKIVTSTLCQDVPRMTTSRRFAELMPPGYADELNQWMREFFGTHDVTCRLADGTIVMSPRTLTTLKHEVSKASFEARHFPRDFA